MTNKYLTKIASQNWIAGATKNHGALHRALGVPEGEKIPDSKIRAAENQPGKVGKEARLAETLKHLHKEAQAGMLKSEFLNTLKLVPGGLQQSVAGRYSGNFPKLRRALTDIKTGVVDNNVGRVGRVGPLVRNALRVA